MIAPCGDDIEKYNFPLKLIIGKSYLLDTVVLFDVVLAVDEKI